VSDTLEAILADASGETEKTVTLSPNSVAVLLYAVYLLEERDNWLDLRENPLDEITVSDWDAIEKIVANASYELMTEVETMPPVGATMIWHMSTPPDRWLMCTGGVVYVADYPELFALWGYKYGASGAQFGLPDIEDFLLMGSGGYVGLDDYSGEASHTLTAAELPSHNHGAAVKVGSGSPARGVVSSGSATLVDINGSTTNIGSGSAHNNIPPVFGVNFIVYAGKP